MTLTGPPPSLYSPTFWDRIDTASVRGATSRCPPGMLAGRLTNPRASGQSLPVARRLCHLIVKQQRIGIRWSSSKYPFRFKYSEKNLTFASWEPPPVNDRLLHRIVTLRKQGKIGEALQLFEELVRQPSAGAETHLEYGYMLDGLSREGRAIVHYIKALTLGLRPADRVSCLICLASSYRNRRRYDKALSTIERAASEFPDNQVVVCFHALILADLGRAEEGLARVGSMAVAQLNGSEMAPFRQVLLSRYNGLRRRAKRKSAHSCKPQ